MLRKKRTRRRSRWLPKQPRLGARMCQGTFFFILRDFTFVISYDNING